MIATERKDGWRMAKTVADCSRVLTLVNLLLCQGVSAARSYIERNTKARAKEKKLARFIDSPQIAINRFSEDGGSIYFCWILRNAL